MREEFLWVEKYRPKSIEECILPEGLKKTFLEFIENKEIPNLLLCGTAGVGKTTVARALCEHLNVDYIMINGSEESGIDVLRSKIKTFASTVSLRGGRKVVLLDEADYLNPQSTQPALRGFIEEFSGNCGFIFTCNFANRLIPPIHSRTSVIDFKTKKAELPKLAGQFLTRVKNILSIENINYDEKVVAELIMKHIPDWRRVLNELQRYSASGTIDVGVLTDFSQVNIENLCKHLKEKNFGNIRKLKIILLHDSNFRDHAHFRFLRFKHTYITTDKGVSAFDSLRDMKAISGATLKRYTNRLNVCAVALKELEKKITSKKDYREYTPDKI